MITFAFIAVRSKCKLLESVIVILTWCEELFRTRRETFGVLAQKCSCTQCMGSNTVNNCNDLTLKPEILFVVRVLLF